MALGSTHSGKSVTIRESNHASGVYKEYYDQKAKILKKVFLKYKALHMGQLRYTVNPMTGVL